MEEGTARCSGGVMQGDEGMFGGNLEDFYQALVVPTE